MAQHIQPRNHLDRGFYAAPTQARRTMTTLQLQQTMMYTEGYITAQGKLWTIVKKSLAPNVWLVSLRETNKPSRPR